MKLNWNKTQESLTRVLFSNRFDFRFFCFPCKNYTVPFRTQRQRKITGLQILHWARPFQRWRRNEKKIYKKRYILPLSFVIAIRRISLSVFCCFKQSNEFFLPIPLWIYLPHLRKKMDNPTKPGFFFFLQHSADDKYPDTASK